MTFREALGLVGGVTAEADTDNITVKREGQTDLIKINYKQAMDGDPAADVVLQPGDTIYVKQLETSSFFTVMGAVNKPGQYPLKGKLTVSEAIGLAGGPIPKVADMKGVTLMRYADRGKLGSAVKINLNDVVARTVQDPSVERGDVIYIKDRKEKPGVLQILNSLVPFGWIF
jgi:protein involved in polysaccharide export with SLBB domain